MRICFFSAQTDSESTSGPYQEDKESQEPLCLAGELVFAHAQTILYVGGARSEMRKCDFAVRGGI